MKRYFIETEVKSNFHRKELRHITLCCSYVYANNKKEAINKFWEQLEKNKNFPFPKHLLKTNAENWEADEKDCNGNQMEDFSWAIPFDLLAIAVWDGKDKRMMIPENITSEPEKAEEASEPVDTRKPSEIIRSSWDWHGTKTQEFFINGKKIRTNLCGYYESYWNGNDIPTKYTRDGNGIHYKAKKSTGEELDDLIAQGYDEIRFVIYASKMVRGYCDVCVWAHKSGKAEIKPESDSATQEKENIQPEPEKATESNSEPHSQPIHHLKGAPRLISTSKRKVIPFEEIKRWNQMLESAKGKSSYYTFTLWHEGRDEHGRWFELGHGNIRAHMIPHPSDVYFIKKIKDEIWIYFEQCGTVEERWLLSDVAKAYFLHESEESSQELSEGSQKAEDEIIKEDAEELTEGKSEAHKARIKINASLEALRAERKKLSRDQRKEFETHGTSERCQELWKKIDHIDEEIKEREAEFLESIKEEKK